MPAPEPAPRSGLRRLVIDVRPASDPIEGQLGDAEGEVRDFHGWLDLAAALQALTSPADPEPGQQRPPGLRRRQPS